MLWPRGRVNRPEHASGPHLTYGSKQGLPPGPTSQKNGELNSKTSVEFSVFLSIVI